MPKRINPIASRPPSPPQPPRKRQVTNNTSSTSSPSISVVSPPITLSKENKDTPTSGSGVFLDKKRDGAEDEGEDRTLLLPAPITSETETEIAQRQQASKSGESVSSVLFPTSFTSPLHPSPHSPPLASPISRHALTPFSRPKHPHSHPHQRTRTRIRE